MWNQNQKGAGQLVVSEPVFSQLDSWSVSQLDSDS